jgi:hypothetical protein
LTIRLLALRVGERETAMVANGSSRWFAAAQQLGRFRSEADIQWVTPEPDL